MPRNFLATWTGTAMVYGRNGTLAVVMAPSLITASSTSETADTVW